MPTVDIRMKAKFQYKKLNIALPRPIAPKCAVEPRCPISAVSTVLTNGTVMLLIIKGMAKRRICLFTSE